MVMRSFERGAATQPAPSPIAVGINDLCEQRDPNSPHQPGAAALSPARWQTLATTRASAASSNPTPRGTSGAHCSTIWRRRGAPMARCARRLGGSSRRRAGHRPPRTSQMPSEDIELKLVGGGVADAHGFGVFIAAEPRARAASAHPLAPTGSGCPWGFLRRRAAASRATPTPW